MCVYRWQMEGKIINVNAPGLFPETEASTSSSRAPTHQKKHRVKSFTTMTDGPLIEAKFGIRSYDELLDSL